MPTPSDSNTTPASSQGALSHHLNKLRDATQGFTEDGHITVQQTVARGNSWDIDSAKGLAQLGDALQAVLAENFGVKNRQIVLQRRWSDLAIRIRATRETKPYAYTCKDPKPKHSQIHTRYQPNYNGAGIPH